MLTPRTIAPYYNQPWLKNSLFVITGLLVLAGIFQGFLPLVKGAATDNAPRLYHSEQFHYSVSYPSTWKVDPVISGTNVVTISAPTSPVNSGFSFNHQLATTSAPFSKVDILAYSLEEPLSVTEFVSSLTKSPLEGQVSQRQLAGQNALLVEPGNATGNPDDVSYRNAFITKNHQGFIIAGLTSAATFDQILESFQLD